MTDTATVLRTTALAARHQALGARMVPYAGWQMPVEYAGISREHLIVRSSAGLFDVSHMGEIEVAGKGALAAVQRVSCNDASQLAVGRAHYSALLTPAGTFVDDVMVYRLGPSHFLLVVNAANVAKDYTWIAEQARQVPDAAVVDSSARYALIAIQGPAAADILGPVATIDVAEIAAFGLSYGEVANARALIARTGYTGEDGFELFVPPAMADRVWQALLESGRPNGILPCGLGARDTLRLEAGMRLYGNDIDETTTVLEAGLGWIIGWNKTEGIGLDRLRAQKATGPARRLVGFELTGAGIARHGCSVLHEGRAVGHVTSGTRTPFIKKAVGMAYVPSALAAPGTTLAIDIRGRAAEAAVVRLPFYTRKRP
jgi:aminomethyltransferase